MKLLSIDIKGVLAVREPLSLDFSSIPAGSLIGIVGQIGNGKTTLLEAPIAALHRKFPSRDKSLVDYATERDSYIDLKFELDGKPFRARVSMDQVARATNAVLQGGGIHTDGKVSTYDAAIRDILPSLDMMLASSFSAQNKAGNVVTLGPKAAKELFVRLIGLERYEPMALTAKNAGALLSEARLRAAARRDAIDKDVTPALLAGLGQEADALNAEGLHAEIEQVHLRELLAGLQRDLATLSEQANAYHRAVMTLAALDEAASARQRDETHIAAQLEKNEQWHAAEIDALAAESDSKKASLKTRLESIPTALAKEVAGQAEIASASRRTLGERIANNRAVLATADTIRAAVERLRVVDHLIQNGHKSRAETEKRRDACQIDMEGVERELRQIERTEEALSRARDAAGITKTVPCGGQGAYASCQFLKDAKRAEADIAALETLIEPRQALSDRRSTLFGDISHLCELLSNSDKLRLNLETERALLLKQTAHAEQISLAEQRIADLSEQLATVAQRELEAIETWKQSLARESARIGHEIEELEQQHAERLARAHSTFCMRKADLDEQLGWTKATLRDQQRERLALVVTIGSTQKAAELAKVVDTNIERCRDNRELVIAILARVKAQSDVLATRRADIERKQAELTVVEARIEQFDDELLEWQTLAKALSRDGLPVLEIDAAGPTVSAYTNELLTACIGPRFTVELVTQEARAGGKGVKEAFELKVWDNTKGGTARDVKDLSGGEQVIVGEALMNAISVYVNTRSPQPVRTFWRDETTGSLDPETARQYVAMLRKAVELGGAFHCFFITHNPDAAALADVQIQVTDGRAEFVYPPFGKVA